MKVAIIEDEAYAADALEQLILECRPKTEILARLESVEESIAWLEEEPDLDLIFSDIHLSDGNSFEIFQEVEIQCPVIFTTAFNEYALKAFKLNSIDYLLKPIKKEELERAIEEYETVRQYKLKSELENLHNLLQNSKKAATKSDIKSRFMVKSGQSIKTIPTEQIAYFLAEEGVVLLVTFQSKRFVVNYTLDDLEQQLEPTTFFRANRQIIVNIEAIKEVNPYFKGRLHLQLKPPTKNDQIISSVKASPFKDWLEL
ncbi:MAG: LytTR family DNA-binding domain-containing protein [Flavobacteriaceae bacterium]|nr:LytTR family DNA-binding domain-containing protein [Flavobacteriaceae bacterium]